MLKLDWSARVDAAIDQLSDRMVTLRRHLHAHPEVSGAELQTSLNLYQEFSNLDLPVRMGPEGKGVVVDSRTDHSRRIALRCDIDALRIHDQKQVDYRSQVPGVMHACGHDAHTAILFGTCLALDTLERAGELPWPIAWRGVFQPSEETCEGARSMVAYGALEQVDAILALHVDPARRVGAIGLRQGVFTSNCDEMRIVVRGRGGHGARPHESKDPIAAAAQLINTLYQFIPRATDSQDAVVISMGQIRGGDNANVIPESVELAGTLRTLDRDIRAQTIEHVQKLARGVAEITETNIEVRFETGISSVYNDSEITSLVTRVAGDLLGFEQLEAMPRPSMGSEDFAAYLEEVPGAMFRLGSCSKSVAATGLHTPLFDVDERCISIGAKILARTVVEWCKPIPEFEI